MTISGNSFMSSYSSGVSNNKNVQSQNTQDTNTKTGFDAIAQMFMSALDINNTGLVDKAEFTQAAKILAKSESSENVDNAFAQIDTNGDSQLSSDEFLNALKEATAEKNQQTMQADKSSLETNLLTQQTDSLIKPAAEAASKISEMQKSLFNKITAAYSNSTAATIGTTTNFSA
jgi:Ca2+-binding EF-hand superfamily protein